MREQIVTTSNLSKKYKSNFALQGVHMQLKRGDIYGFVGENGAGKTTLIRSLMGLCEPTSGSLSLFGSQTAEELIKQRSRVGCIIESPALYPDMTARENLEVYRLAAGIPDKSLIEQTLQQVNLADTGKKRAKHFSLGMKQRLGLAIALLREPELLVLDEPINGLDPSSIVEIRELLKTLNRDHGITILISSHILGELYQLATCYGFISHGKMVEELTLAELNQKCKKHLFLKVDDGTKAVPILEQTLGTTQFEVVAEKTIQLYDFLEQPEVVARALSDGGVLVTELSTKGQDLESYYMQLIGGKTDA